MPAWFLWLSLALMITMSISWLHFGRFTMARIEKQIKADGLDRPCPWDGPGARIMWYAYAIALPLGRFNRADDPTINVPLVRNYTTRADAIGGWVLIFSSGSLAILAFIAWFLWTGDSA